MLCVDLHLDLMATQRALVVGGSGFLGDFERLATSKGMLMHLAWQALRYVERALLAAGR